MEPDMHDASFWDQIAPAYSQQPVADPAAWQRKLRVHKALIKPTDAVLDVGCGTGSLCLELAPHAKRVHGVDFSAEMVAIARGKAAGLDHVTFTQGTLDDLDRAYDVVSAYSLLHLVPDLDVALAALYAIAIRARCSVVSSFSNSRPLAVSSSRRCRRSRAPCFWRT